MLVQESPRLPLLRLDRQHEKVRRPQVATELALMAPEQQQRLAQRLRHQYAQEPRFQSATMLAPPGLELAQRPAWRRHVAPAIPPGHC